VPVSRTHNLTGKAGRLEERCKTVLALAANVVKDRIQELAPLDQGHLTRGVTVGNPRRIGNRVAIEIFSQMAYWKYLELDQYLPKNLGPKSRAKGSKIPFIKPAFEEKRAEAIEIIEQGYRQALRDLVVTRRR
jgi:hypothetical protein